MIAQYKQHNKTFLKNPVVAQKKLLKPEQWTQNTQNTGTKQLGMEINHRQDTEVTVEYM